MLPNRAPGRGLWQRGQGLWSRGLFPRLLRLDRAFSVRVKLLIPVVVLSLLTIGSLAWMWYQSERDRVQDHFRDMALVVARAFQANFEGPQDLENPLILQSYIWRLQLVDPALLRANVYGLRDGQAQILASSDPSLVGQPADSHDLEPLFTGDIEASELRLAGQNVLEVNAPVLVDGLPVATLGIYRSLAARDAALRSLLIRTAAMTGAVVVGLLVLLGLVFRLLVLSRLHKLATASRHLASGDLDARVAGDWDATSRDELVALAHHFNEMAQALQDSHRQLEQQAITDCLTGLYNRRYFEEALEREVQRAQRLQYPLALLMLDIDHFKVLNDRYGHQVGDEVLRWVAMTLRLNLRSLDTAARYGGEEFAALLPGSDAAAAEAVAERLRLAVQQIRPPVNHHSLPSIVTVSVGAAVYPDQASNPIELVARADEAMYQAKRQGRNRVCLAT